MEEFKFGQIGIIHSPFKEPTGTPIQPTAARNTEGTVELLEPFTAGLKDLQGFSHIILIYVFHLVRETSLEVIPFMDNEPHGIFSTRAPGRPNAIGISTVRLIRINGPVLHVRDLDMVDGTPLLDIKPYVPAFDHRDEIRIGWLQKNISKLQGSEDDGRFIY
jgi:tRNA-Thr(GGU) m(6)t(6)A37 methyltransferase TsaA